MPDLSDELKETYIETAKALKGSERRQFMARIVRTLGYGGQSYAAREFRWGRQAIRKGERELENGPIEDKFSARGRKRAEEHLPQLLDDIRAIVDGQSQTDPRFESQRLYTRLSVRVVREQLIEQKGYTDEELPGEETIRVKMNEMGYQLRSVSKTRPQKDS